MTHTEKVDRLLAELSACGINEYTTAPPIWRALWKLGIEVPPPHFLSFVPLAFSSGLLFGVLWGLAMWFLVWQTMPWMIAVSAAVAAGVLFGFFIAKYYQNAAAKLELPSWKHYPN